MSLPLMGLLYTSMALFIRLLSRFRSVEDIGRRDALNFSISLFSRKRLLKARNSAIFLSPSNFNFIASEVFLFPSTMR